VARAAGADIVVVVVVVGCRLESEVSLVVLQVLIALILQLLLFV
jgi:hypothetical protein